ncbi:J domain-containing protein [Sphingomonas sp. Leaf412]|uniref:J domain-containing protein n=1 Tax=Sphingomonas sp. Leaf412 TaxID=1736370 RepID=UPI000A9DD88B|nr:J domain-containing protein [Sphingomonas sp. Leaf412]
MMKWIVAAVLIWIAWRVFAKPKVKDPAVAARRLLGVGARADAADIRAAHRRLMSDAHPDRGGSGEEARRLNAARDMLLARIGE